VRHFVGCLSFRLPASLRKKFTRSPALICINVEADGELHHTEGIPLKALAP
jgi:hypothetical protein